MFLPVRLPRVASVGLLILSVGGLIAACSSDDAPVEATPSIDASVPTGDGGGPVIGDDGDDASIPPEGDAGRVRGAALDLAGLPARTWTWFDIPGAFCRDGSPAGFGLNVDATSKKTVFFLQGGGACFDTVTCLGNPSKVTSKSMSSGIFDRGNAANPVAGWNQVYVPYCTGDVHAGNNPDGNVPGVGPQKFVGYENTRIFLETLASTFPDMARLLVTGASAGGFGAAANYGQAVRVFPSIPVNLVDDAGPLMREPPLAHCLQEKWRTLWNLEATVIAECGSDCQGKPDFLMAASRHWMAAKPAMAQGLISATEDQTIRFFFGFGSNDCTSTTAVSGPAFTAGLVDIKAQSASSSNFGTYLYAGTTHTLLGGAGYTSTTLGTKSVAAWVKDIVDDDVVTNIGP